MAVKDGSGQRPAAHSAKRCFLNCLATTSKPCLCLHCQRPTCLRPLAAGFRAARLRSRDPVAGLKHHGNEGRHGPAAGSPDCQTLLSEWLETSLLLPVLLHCQLPTCLRPLAAGAASFRAARLWSRDPFAGLKHHVAVKDGSGPRPAAHSVKRCFLNLNLPSN